MDCLCWVNFSLRTCLFVKVSISVNKLRAKIYPEVEQEKVIGGREVVTVSLWRSKVPVGTILTGYGVWIIWEDIFVLWSTDVWYYMLWYLSSSRFWPQRRRKHKEYCGVIVFGNKRPKEFFYVDLLSSSLRLR